MEYIYAALLLHKLGKEVSEHNIKSVITASGMQTDESKIKSLVASLKGVDIDKELANASLAASAPAPAAHKEEKEEKVHEEKHEAAAEGLSALFG